MEMEDAFEVDFFVNKVVMNKAGSMLLASNNQKLSFYDLAGKAKMVTEYTELGTDLGDISVDSYYERYAVANRYDVIILDRRSSSKENLVNKIKDAHADTISSVDFNAQNQNTLMTSSYDMRVKVWDLRKNELPLYVLENSKHQIECARYNPIYDQVVAYSTPFGTACLQMLSSVSSQPIGEFNEPSRTTKSDNRDYVIQYFEGCLGDSIVDIAWSSGSLWSFGAVSYSSGVYFDTVPSEERYKILL